MGNQNDIHRVLGQIEGKIDAIVSNSEDMKSRLDIHNERLKSVETFKIQIVALAGGAATLVSGFWQIVKVKIGG